MIRTQRFLRQWRCNCKSIRPKDLESTEYYSKEILKALRSHFPELKLAYLFGSFAKNQATPNSDLDVAVYCGSAIDNIKRWDVSQALAIQLDKTVDLLDLASCSTVMRFQVIDSGLLLFDADCEASAFENVTISMYQHLNESRDLIVNDFLGRLRDG